MRSMHVLCLLLCAAVVLSRQSSLVPRRSQKLPPISNFSGQLKITDFNTLMSVRGGATKEIDMENTNDNIIVKKLRNIIRSFLQVSERKSPALATTVRSFVGTLEKILGVRLLPKVDTDEKKKKKKKSKTATDSAKQGTKEAKAASSKKSKPEPNNAVSASKKRAAKSTGAAQSHVESKIKSTSPNYRIQRELKEFLRDPPPNLSVKVGKNLRIWIITMKGAPNTIYEGETFKLRVSFPAQYPTVPPSVYFLPPHIPVHEHVYTNGDICLSLLGKDWRPTMTAQSIAVSILSILSSAQSKSLPMDNARHAQNKPGEFQEGWVYHDDNC